jgi:nitrogenase-stabilizing/protective protein
MSETELDLDLDELSSAEDFLDYFGVEYQPAVVHVNRLHILQRFHDYLAQVSDMPADDSERFRLYAELLKGAYQDFVNSDAVTEKVFKVFKMHGPQQVFVPLTDLRGAVINAS